MYGSKCQLNYGLGNTTFHEEAGNRIREVFHSFCEPLVFDEHLIYTINNKFRGCKLLVLGGGGSTQRWIDSKPALNYDTIWSLNSFYKNDYIKNNLKVDLFTVGPEVDLHDNILLDYLHKHNTIAAVELHQKWGRTFNNPESGKTPEEMKNEINEFYKDNKKVFQTKFYSQLGGGVRLLIYAAHIGVAKIDFIGFDGPQAILDGDPQPIADSTRIAEASRGGRVIAHGRGIMEQIKFANPYHVDFGVDPQAGAKRANKDADFPW